MSEGDLDKSEDLDAAWDDVPPPSLPISSMPPSVSKPEIPEELDSGWDDLEAPRKRYPSRKRREPGQISLAPAAVADVKPVGPTKKERRDQQRRNRAHADQRERERKEQRKAERREAAEAAQAAREKARLELEKARAKAARKAAKLKKQQARTVEGLGVPAKAAEKVIEKKAPGHAQPAAAPSRSSLHVGLAAALVLLAAGAAFAYLR